MASSDRQTDIELATPGSATTSKEADDVEPTPQNDAESGGPQAEPNMVTKSEQNQGPKLTDQTNYLPRKQIIVVRTLQNTLAGVPRSDDSGAYNRCLLGVRLP
jgi:hypothetical protein